MQGSPAIVIGSQSLLGRIRAVGLIAILALLSGCESFSWGNNNSGQLGNGSIGGSSAFPIGAASGFEWLELSVGYLHSCGVRKDATLWCWGENNFGQLGQGYDGVDSALPLQVGTATDWKSVAAGYRHTCAIRAGGQLWCWGRGTSGELGDGLSTSSFLPVRVGTATDWTQVSAGIQRFTCGIRSPGNLYCWGLNTDGQLGLGDYVNRSVPTLVAGGPWLEVDAGAWHVCGIQGPSHSGYCWGDNTYRQVENALSTANFPAPRELGGSYHLISAGFGNTCWVTKSTNPDTDRIAKCFGNFRDLSGENSTFIFEPVGCPGDPCDDAAAPKFRTLDVGVEHACGVLQGSNLGVCWGDGSLGQQGDGDLGFNQIPQFIFGVKEWSSIGAGRNFSVGLELP